MKILGIQVLRGPNIWSIKRKKLIQMRLDLEDLEQKPTNLIEGFEERLEKTIPSLYSHRCSKDGPGGFFERVKEGTWMGHVIEHIALEIQTLRGWIPALAEHVKLKPRAFTMWYSAILKKRQVSMQRRLP
jgi:cyanophycin synthetase